MEGDAVEGNEFGAEGDSIESNAVEERCEHFKHCMKILYAKKKRKLK